MNGQRNTLGTITVWLGFGGTALVAVFLVTMTVLEREFNPDGTLFLCSRVITYLGL